MPRLSIICLPALVALAACNAAPDDGTARSESEGVPVEDGTMTAPYAASGADAGNAANAADSMDAKKGNSGGADTPSDSSQGMMSDGTTPPAGAGAETEKTDMDGTGSTPPPPNR